MTCGGSTPGTTVDLLGSQSDILEDLYPSLESPGSGRTVDLSAGGGINLSSSSSSSSSVSAPSSRANVSLERGPTSIEGNRPTLSLVDFTPANIVRQITSRPMTDLVRDHGHQLVQIPRNMCRAYFAASQRYLSPWSEFLRLRPTTILDGFRRAHERGQVQIYVQRNVLANTRQFCPNYIFMFLAMLCMFVCTSPMLLGMLSVVGGGWSHALRSDEFRSRPWQLQVGGVSLPLGANVKMLLMALPTLLFLHMFMGPVLWSAAFYSGGASLLHASLRDRDDGSDGDELGSDRIEELP